MSSAEALRSARARVDLGRLERNYRALERLAGRPLMPVLKADAYGHGAVAVARRLEALGAAVLAVAYVQEGSALRAGGVRVPIVVLTPFAPGQEGVVLREDLTPVVSTVWGLRTVLDLARGPERPLPVHLKVDTGMTRLGLLPQEAPAAAEALAARPGLRLEGLMTHLASADEDAQATERQLDVFDDVARALGERGLRPPLVHAANSAGLAFLRPGHTMVRPGLLLYGVRPRPLSPDVAVEPVMTVSARIARLVEVPAGTAVSYGGRWVAERPSRIATLPLGYADGVPRTDAMRQRGAFVVRGRRAPVVGTVCMDLTMLDVTGVPEAAEGDEAVLFGDAPGAWEVAACAGTNAWQALTAISPRVPREHVG